MKNMVKIRKPFLYALALSLIGGSFFYWAYFTKAYFFKEVKMEIKGPNTIKITMFSDLHASEKKQAGGEMFLGDEYEKFLNEFLAHAKAFPSNLVVMNGDLIEGTRKPVDLGTSELRLVQKFLDEIPQEKAWVVGNHDLRSVNRSQWKAALGIDYLDKSFEINDYKIIILDSNYGSEGKMNDSEGADTGVLLSDFQLAWLENELKNSDKTKIVFMHHPPVTGDEIKPSYTPRDIEKIQNIFSECGVVAVFSGHTERLAHKKLDGVDYYVFPGPTKFDFYPGAFESIRMIDKKAIVTFFSKNEKGEYVRQKVE